MYMLDIYYGAAIANSWEILSTLCSLQFYLTRTFFPKQISSSFNAGNCDSNRETQITVWRMHLYAAKDIENVIKNLFIVSLLPMPVSCQVIKKMGNVGSQVRKLGAHTTW